MIRGRRLFYGWWIVGSFAVLNVYWAGTLIVGLTVFFTPVRHAFGWSAALLALIFSATNIVTGLMAPLVGAWFDRSGPRALMLIAGLVSGTGLLLLSRTDSMFTFVLAFMVVSAGFGIWAAGTGPAAAGLWFKRRRGIAMGIILAGVSLGGVMVPLWKLIVAAAGWRAAFVIAGLGLWLITVPASWLLQHRPSDLGLRPDGDPAPAEEFQVIGGDAPLTTALRVDEAAAGLRVALHTRQFWVLAVASALAVAGSSAAVVLMLPRLQEAHLNDDLAVAAVTIVTLMGAVARLGTGLLADRFSATALAAISVALQAAGLLAFAIAPQQLPLLALFVLAFGLGSDNIRLLAAVIFSEYYGPAAFGRIQGTLYLAILPGRVLGPVIAGALHDAGHGYAAAFILFALISLAMAPPLLSLRPPAPYTT